MRNTWTITLIFLLLELLPFMCYQFSCPLYNFKTAWHIFMKLHTNVKHHKQRAEHMNHYSGFPTFWVIALCVLIIFLSSP